MSQEPEHDAHIRALLGELGSGPDGDPMPPEVAARLEDTVARLAAERAASSSEEPLAEEQADPADPVAPVVPLRRRWLPRAAAAAAAVIVLGTGGVAASQLGLFGSEALTSSDSEGAASDASERRVEATAPDATAVPQLTATSFDVEVADLLRSEARGLSTPESPDSPDTSDNTEEPPRADARELDDGTTSEAPGTMSNQACPGPRPTDGSLTHRVLFDGRPAVLVVHPEGSARPGRPTRRLVEAWDCAGEHRLASATLTR